MGEGDPSSVTGSDIPLIGVGVGVTSMPTPQDDFVAYATGVTATSRCDSDTGSSAFD
jgi:hypothetical protein